jgi:hypothetical protein
MYFVCRGNVFAEALPNKEGTKTVEIDTGAMIYIYEYIKCYKD